MKKWNKTRTMILVLATLMVLSMVVFVFIKQLAVVTDNSVVSSMQEISRHDVKNIQSELDNAWNDLSSIYERTTVTKCSNVQEVCRRLNLEQISNIFNTIYMIDSNGNTYSSSNMIKNEREKPYVKSMLTGKEKTVMRYDTMDALEARTQNLVYSVQCEPFEVKNIRFIGIIGFSKISLMAQRLKIDSFDGSGYTGIIDRDGNYVVNHNPSSGIGKMDNYFEQLKKRTNLSEDEISNLIARFERGEEFLLHLNFIDQGEQVVSFTPMPGTTWSLALTVPQKVFSQQSQQFILMTTIMLVSVVIILCVMMFIVIRISLASATAKAEARSRGEFLSNMSHEIRTPLNGIIGLNHLMQDHTDDPEKLREYLQKSDSAAKYLLSLVNDILDMSKLQANKMVLVPKPFSVTYLISTLESLIRSRMEDKGIDFRIETDLIYTELIGDDTRIEQILVNILGNAVKFTPEGGRVTMRVFQSVDEDRVTTTYQVEDTGCGISEEFQNKIFDSFSQERNNVSQGNQGTGLGMSISALLAKQMGGTLSVRSKLGEGSCFTFVMTTDIVPEAPDTAAIRTTEHESVNIVQKLNILVAEDNALNAEILLEILNAAGFTTVHARDGEEVVHIFRESKPFTFDIILMDIQMPVRNGFEATRLIRESDRPDAKTVTIYACTANSFKEDQEKALEAGMNGFISKPIDINKLMQKLGITK